MKKTFSLFFILFMCQLSSGQQYADIDKKVLSYPVRIDSYQQLAQMIKTDFQSKEDQTRAIFTWIAHNISYDVDKYYSLRARKISFYYTESERARQKKEKEDRLVHDTFIRRKGLCGGYATLFKVLCRELEIPAIIIGGYTKIDATTIGGIPRIKNHAWNAVYLNNSWHLLDTTWAAGIESLPGPTWNFKFNDHFYKESPEQFINHHLPSDSRWQLLKTPVSKEHFFGGPIFLNGYFDSGIQLSFNQSGTLRQEDASDENLYIKFDQVPDNKLYYSTIGTIYPKRLQVKKVASGGYVGSIKLKHIKGQTLNLISKRSIVANFKIERSLKK